jgi:hypothetical protein
MSDRSGTIAAMPNLHIEGHDIEIVGDDEIPPEARRPVTFNIESGQGFGVDLPVHPTKSTLFKFRLDGTNLPDNEYLILQPPAVQRTHGIKWAKCDRYGYQRQTWPTMSTNSDFSTSSALSRSLAGM